MIRDTLVLLAELTVLFIGVAFVIGLTQRWLGEDRLRRWMGGPPVVSALKGIGVGFITPFCTYSAIPVLVGLRRADVPPAGYVAFIVAAPVLDPVLFGALVLIVGLAAAVVYALVAFAAALSLALLAQRLGVQRNLKPAAALVGASAMSAGPATDVVTLDACNDSQCAEPENGEWKGLGFEAAEAGLSALRLFAAMAPVLLLGVGIGVGIQLLVPPDLIASIAGSSNQTAIPLAAGLGTPLYFNTGLFVPIADSLATVGVGIGAIVALTIAGAGANIPEFVILSRFARARVLVVFVGYVFAVAVVGGYLAQVIAG